MSERVLDYLIDHNNLELGSFSDRKELGLVKDLMRGSMQSGEGEQSEHVVVRRVKCMQRDPDLHMQPWAAGWAAQRKESSRGWLVGLQ